MTEVKSHTQEKIHYIQSSMILSKVFKQKRNYISNTKYSVEKNIQPRFSNPKNIINQSEKEEIIGKKKENNNSCVHIWNIIQSWPEN